MALTEEQRIDVARFLGNIQSDWPEDELSPAQLQAFAAEQTMPEQEPTLPPSDPPKPELSPGTELSTPSGYLAALDKARQLDAIQAAAAAASQGIAQVGQIASRGLFKPQAAPPILSAAADIEQRRAAVMDFVRQERERQRAAADLGLSPLRRDLLLQQTAAAKALAEQRAREPEPRPSLVAKEEAEAEKKRKETELLGKPKPIFSPKHQRDLAGEKQAEYERRLKEGIPAGYELAAGAQPTTKQREEAAKIVISRGMVDESINQVRELLKTPGAVANPRVRDLLAQQGQFIQTQLRVLEDLGVPSGPDAKILETLIGNPSSIVGEALDTTQQKLDALGKYVGKRVDKTASTYGLQRKQTVPTPAASTVKVRRKSDGAVVDVPADDVEKFVAAGKVERLP